MAMAATATPCWLSCDPGHDDAMAIILSLMHPAIQLLGISSVGGNQTVDRTTENVLRILSLINRPDIPVIRGSAVPLQRAPKICPEIHGDSGLDGAWFPPHGLQAQTFASDDEAADAIYDRIIASSSDAAPVVFITTGAQTDLARLLLRHPDVQRRISAFVFMGGSTDGTGNTSPYAEFNIEIDPEACSQCLASQIPRIVMVPLQVTHTALCTDDVMGRIRAMQTPFSETVCHLLLFFRETYRTVFGFSDPPLHDPCAVAYVIDPSRFSTRSALVAVDCSDTAHAGEMRLQWDHPQANVVVCEAMDVQWFWDLMIEALRAANARTMAATSNSHCKVGVHSA